MLHVRRIHAAACQSAFNLDPRSACKIDPPERHVRGTVEVVPVANRGVPVGPPGQPCRSYSDAGSGAVFEAPALVSVSMISQ